MTTRLVSWADVKALIVHLHPNHTLPSSSAISFGWPNGANPSAETIEANYAEIGGRGRLFLGAFVAKEDDVSMREALALNGQMLIGCLVSYHGKIICRHVMTIGRFDAAELAEAIETIGRAAGSTRAALVRR